MANQHGGYRRPGNPPAVSGPGAMSQRTDGAPAKMTVTDVPYGAVQDFAHQQSAAPMGGGINPSPSVPARPQVPMPTPMGAPTSQPNQPVTAGADAGPGASMAEAGIQQSGNDQLRASLGPYLPVLMRMADSPTSTPTFRAQVRELIARANT